MPDSCQPDVAEKHPTSEARTLRPQNHNPPAFQTPEDRSKKAPLPVDLHPQNPRNETPVTADHSHGNPLNSLCSMLSHFQDDVIIVAKKTESFIKNYLNIGYLRTFGSLTDQPTEIHKIPSKLTFCCFFSYSVTTATKFQGEHNCRHPHPCLNME